MEIRNFSSSVKKYFNMRKEISDLQTAMFVSIINTNEIRCTKSLENYKGQFFLSNHSNSDLFKREDTAVT